MTSRVNGRNFAEQHPHLVRVDHRRDAWGQRTDCVVHDLQDENLGIVQPAPPEQLSVVAEQRMQADIRADEKQKAIDQLSEALAEASRQRDLAEARAAALAAENEVLRARLSERKKPKSKTRTRRPSRATAGRPGRSTPLPFPSLPTPLRSGGRGEEDADYQ